MTRLNEFPNSQRRAIEVVKEVAAEKECRPFLVGGPVRDLLLGRNAFDIDLTLEEGSSTLARALAKRLDGRVRSFPQFLTYKVTASEFPEIDIATARKERYRAPGSLPAVAPGRLKDDLMRRDFSINAIAMDLQDESLHDPADGARDLKKRLIRVLHEKSFIDDPTRIFRAIRLASRLGFSIQQETAALLRQAVTSGALLTASKERLWRELFLAMEEEEAPAILSALNHYHVLEALFGVKIGRRITSGLELIRTELTVRPDLDRYVLYTGALLRGSGASVSQLEGSGFSQKRARAAMQIAHDLPRLQKALAAAPSDRQRFRLYKSVAPEMLALLMADKPAEGEHVIRFEEFRKFKLALRGNELEVPAGPHVARALERTREAVFSGEIAPDQARSFAREMAIKYLGRE
ncbi:MAG: CCA tRNA nucleotidyltransferase [Thermoanaerobaculia bacterium]|nr:CCA tRNA nucleotidyltransferase [Thermoanaerobaculia bacterium]